MVEKAASAQNSDSSGVATAVKISLKHHRQRRKSRNTKRKKACIYAIAKLPYVSTVIVVPQNVTDNERPVAALQQNDAVPVISRQREAELAVDKIAFSTIDLVVFCHASTAMSQVGLGRNGQFQQVVAIATRHRDHAPYLMDQVLAFAAIHLSMYMPGHSLQSPLAPLATNITPENLRHHATLRQTRAVACFKGLMSKSVYQVDPDSACARLLFAGLLSLQNLAETLCVLRDKSLSFSHFIDSIVHCLNLHRGIRAATGKPIHEFMYHSRELIPIMEILSIIVEVDRQRAPCGSECEPLNRMLETSDLGEASIETCKAAVRSLQWSFDIYKGLSVQDGPHATAAFSLTAPAGYVEALRRYCPEALVIFAYYGVLLHRCRQYWVFGDAGARIIRAIVRHVGNYWKDALSWPLSLIEAEDGSW
ncbi:hypothetical protein NQ176_g2462 [Zarea fungicola]|uniref:Uncharacterized protein n=1 Tax=Zarea fungicola TaxID=93591 RepID=A0ACC1NN85_9HYPO|nr:hypothetical protein NQ176_g2462 [Lecanicillium fungicola]